MSIQYFKNIFKIKTDSALAIYDRFLNSLNSRKEFKECGIVIQNDQFTFAGRTFRFGLSYIQKENLFAINMDNTAFDPGKGTLFRFTFDESLSESGKEGLIKVMVHSSTSSEYKELGRIEFEKLTAPDSNDRAVTEFMESFFKWLEKSYSDKVLKLK